MDRFTLCLEDGLLEKLDSIVSERGYPSRSQAMADFIRRAIVKREFKDGSSCIAAISIIYETGKKSPVTELEKILECNMKKLCSMQTVFIKKGFAILVMTAMGLPEELQALSDSLRAVKGVTHGSFSIVSSISKSENIL